MTPEERARLAEEDRLGDLAAGMVDVAGDLAIAVREEDSDEIGRIITRIADGQPLPEPVRALLTVMAGMLPIDDMSAADMLAWVRWDQHQRPLGGPVREVPVPGRYRQFDQLQPCGTYAAFRRHEDRGELIDDECRAAARAYWAGRKRQQPARRASSRDTGPVAEERPQAACGTYAAYARHKRHGEPIDDECQTAARSYWNGRDHTRVRRRKRARRSGAA